MMDEDIKGQGLILAMLIGDGYAYGRYNKLLEFCHHLPQQGYAEWKMGLLQQYVHPSTSMFAKKHVPPQVCVRTPYHHKINAAWKKLYQNGRKVITPEVLEKLEDIGVAIWYMDDGNVLWRTKTRHGNPAKEVRACGVQLSTHSFSKDENELIAEWFLRKYNILFGVYSDHRGKGNFLRATQKEHINRFFSLVSPYVNMVDCMKYKINYVAQND
ncbi:MAG: hypothetical protein U0350_27670 [Caldilineaceae bacterium]